MTERLNWTELKTILGTSLVAQMVKNKSVMQETLVQSLGQEDPLKEGMATHFGILAWRIPWQRSLGRLESMGLKELDSTKRLKVSLFTQDHINGETLNDFLLPNMLRSRHWCPHSPHLWRVYLGQKDEKRNKRHPGRKQIGKTISLWRCHGLIYRKS